MKTEPATTAEEVLPDQLMRWGCQFLTMLLFLLAPIASSGCFYDDFSPRPDKTDEKRLGTGVDNWNAWRAKSGSQAGDLSRSDLSGMDLTGANLSKTRFHGNWTNSRFRSNMNGTVLRDANLCKAKVSYCLLVKADLSGAVLRDASIGFSDLTGANLRNVDARDAWFRESNLSGAILTGADFSKADFGRANLTGAQLSGVDLTGADLTMADLTDVTEWKAIKSIKCANIYGVQAPYAFKKWALDNGALEYDNYRELRWSEFRDACLDDLD